MSRLKNKFKSRSNKQPTAAVTPSDESLGSAPMDSDAEPRYYDLNSGNENLTHWELEHALREIIANALDEQRQTGTAPIEVFWDEAGKLNIRDYGRGLQESHLVVGGAKLKEKDSNAIGHFDAGLKDALSVFYRDKIRVEFRSKYLYSQRLTWRTKGENTETIHVELEPIPDSSFVGTEFILDGISTATVDRAKSLFLFFQDTEPIEIVKDDSGGVMGEIYEAASGEAYLYVNGQQMSEAKNFLFSYNLLNVPGRVKSAPGRDRQLRTFEPYKKQIVKLLRNAKSSTVIDALVEDFEKPRDQSHEEQAWTEVRLIASENRHSKGTNLVYITHQELMALSDNDREMAEDLGYEFAEPMTETEVRSLLNRYPEANTLDSVREQYDRSFEFTLVETEELSKPELHNLTIATENAKRMLSGAGLKHDFPVLVSETLRITTFGGDTDGVWRPIERDIVLKRSVLQDLKRTYIVIFHELAHAQNGHSDNTRDFENDLEDAIGILAMALFSDSYPDRIAAKVTAL